MALGVHAGRTVSPLIGGRRTKPQLVDLLNTALKHGAKRIMLSGAIRAGTPGRPHWLTAETVGWRSAGHWLRSRTPTGRFEHIADGFKLEVRLVREWFPGDDVPAPSAREAWNITTSLLRRYGAGGGLLNSPAGTGQNLWAHTLPSDPNYDYGATLITTDKIDGIAAADGRFMYAALAKGELGEGPARMLTGEDVDGLPATTGMKWENKAM